MRHKGARRVKIMVGRLTLAAALVAAGLLLIADNVANLGLLPYAARLWPVLLIALGTEWIWVARRSPAGQHLRPDVGALALLVILALLSSSHASYTARLEWGRAQAPGNGSDRMAPLIPPEPPSPPQPPSLPGSDRRDGSLPPEIAVGNSIVLRHDETPPGLKSVQLTDTSARVEAVTGERFRVELRVTLFGPPDPQRERDAGRARLLVEPGETTVIRAQRPEVFGRHELAYRVELPPGVSLLVVTTSGPISVTGIRGAVTVQTASGGIQVRSAGGAVTATSSSGEISVQLPADASVTANVRSKSGTVTGPAWLIIGEGRNSGQGTVGAGEHNLMVQSSSGSIRIGGD